MYFIRQLKIVTKVKVTLKVAKGNFQIMTKVLIQIDNWQPSHNDNSLLRRS